MEPSDQLRKFIVGIILLIFIFISLISVKGMGKLEDVIVYTKLFILIVISTIVLIHKKYYS